MTTAATLKVLDQGKQAVTGVVAPQVGEAIIRVAWPDVTGSSNPIVGLLAGLARVCVRSIILAPLGWLLLLPLFVKKIAPFIGKRYVLTNRRLMMVRFGSKAPYRELALDQIENVEVAPGTYSDYYRSATLDVYSGGQVAMRLLGVPEPEGYRHAIVNAVRAWAPRKNP